MKSGQVQAKAPTARQNAIAMGEASRRATPVDLSQNPIQPQTRRHKSQSFREHYARNPKCLLGFVPQNGGSLRIGTGAWRSLRTRPFSLTASKNQRDCKICKIWRSARINSHPPEPQNGFVPQNAALSESAPKLGGRFHAQPSRLTTAKTGKRVRSVRSRQRPSPEHRHGFVPQNDGFPKNRHRPSTKPEPAGLCLQAQREALGKPPSASETMKHPPRLPENGESGCDGSMPTQSHCPPRIHKWLRSAKSLPPSPAHFLTTASTFAAIPRYHVVRRAPACCLRRSLSHESPAVRSLSRILQDYFFPANPKNLQSLFAPTAQLALLDGSYSLAENG